MRELVSREVWNPTSEKLDFEKKKRVASSKGERGSRHEGGITTRSNQAYLFQLNQLLIKYIKSNLFIPKNTLFSNVLT